MAEQPRDIVIVCAGLDGPGAGPAWAHRMRDAFTARGHRVRLAGTTAGPAGAAALPTGRGAGAEPGSAEPPVLLPAVPAADVAPGGRLSLRRGLRARRRSAAVRRGGSRLSGLFRSVRGRAVVIAVQPVAMEWVHRADTAGLNVIAVSLQPHQSSAEAPGYERLKALYRTADRFVTLADADADAWAADGLTNAEAIGPPLPAPPGHPAPTEPTVVAYGPLVHASGFDLLVQAWALTAPSFPQWRLHIHGSGPEEAVLRAQVETAGVAPTLRITPDPGLGPALESASMFVLPSRRDGFSAAMLAALAAGLPVVAFDCSPAVRQMLVDDRNGLVVPAGDIPRLADALGRAMKDGELRDRLGSQARGSVADYAPERVAARWEELFALLDR